ncbi:MAG TPA: NAD-dependent epimerase/dehydratase family protein [Thermomicrobiaceae bacterium]|nr:NAD-dependent epimerase/dehydratase family protein [Thermomicrobiaceae bacterium]
MSGQDEVFLTGATGFVGSHVLSALLEAGYQVRALVRPDGHKLNPPGGCRIVSGDLRRPGELVPALGGCRYLVHVAALYTFAPAQRHDVWDINVRGTAGLLEAARIAGVERAVVTSSSATVGPAAGGRLATEVDWAGDSGSVSAYHGSKVRQERAALAARVPVVTVLPTTPVGPGDARPTPTGKMIVDFMRGRMFASIGGGLNLVAVEDVARAHVLALQQGRERERYLIGGENLMLADIWQRLAAITGRTAPKREIPYGLALALGWGDELRCRMTSSEPLVPIEGVHMARHRMWVDCAKARDELGFEPSSVDAALGRAVDWFREHGYAN